MSRIAKALDFVTARREAGLSDETMTVLLHLSSEGAGTKDMIAKATGINSSTMPRYLTLLVGSGHVEKSTDPESDGRLVFFKLSAHGTRLVDSLLKHFPA